MTVQQRPQNAANDYHALLSELGNSAENNLTKPEITPPSYGGPQRDAINSVVDGIVGDICSKVSELRKMLDAIEQQVLQSAAKSKQALNDHVLICVKVNDEVMHAREVIAELAEQTREP